MPVAQLLIADDMSKWLLLIPTKFEKKQIQAALDDLSGQAANASSIDLTVETCGFGPVVSAAQTTRLLIQHKPDQVLLLGIAGSLDEGLKVGAAYRFSSVGCHGVGVGEGDQFQTSEQMGWKQSINSVPIENPIQLSGAQETRQLLTVCAASENTTQAQIKRKLFPDAVAEDMEGYSVALACQIQGVKLIIVRGVSNAAGVRDKSKWQVAPAMKAAFELSRQIILKEENGAT